MGTRSLTIFVDDDGNEIVVLYRQYDGYPSGHGMDLYALLHNMNLVNGIGIDDGSKVANGMGCLAAQVVAALKTGPGGFYLYPAGTRDCWEEYRYTLRPEANDIHLTVDEQEGSRWNTIFDGNIQDFAEYVKNA